MRFAAAGAARIHLVDLDGARAGRARPELVRTVAEAIAPTRLQASGGIRSLEDAEALLAAGADRVVVGTAAFPDPVAVRARRSATGSSSRSTSRTGWCAPPAGRPTRG